MWHTNYYSLANKYLRVQFGTDGYIMKPDRSSNGLEGQPRDATFEMLPLYG